MFNDTYSNNLNSIPNIDYKDMLQLKDPERKGLLYGSLISAILGAGATAATGGNWGESLARGLQAGSAAISEGSKGLRDYKKMVLEAARLQQQDEMARQAHQREEDKFKLYSQKTGLEMQSFKKHLEKQQQQEQALKELIGRFPLQGTPTAMTKQGESILGNNLIAKGLEAGLDINSIKSLYGLFFPQPEIKVLGQGQEVVTFDNQGQTKVLHRVPFQIRESTPAPTSKDKDIDFKLMQQATKLAQQNPRFFMSTPDKQEEIIRNNYNMLKNTLQGTTPNTGKSKVFVEKRVKKLNGRHFLIGIDENGKEHLIGEIERK